MTSEAVVLETESVAEQEGARLYCTYCNEPQLERRPVAQRGVVVYECHNPNCDYRDEISSPF